MVFRQMPWRNLNVLYLQNHLYQSNLQFFFKEDMMALFDKTYLICCLALCIFLTSNSLLIDSCINCSSILAGISVTVIVPSSLSHPFGPSQILGVFVVLQSIEISLFFQDLLNTDRSYSSPESSFKIEINYQVQFALKC